MAFGTTYDIFADLKGAEGVVAKYKTIEDAAGKAGARIALSVRYGTEAWAKDATNTQKIAAGYHRMRYAMSEMRGIWEDQARSIKKYTDAAMKLNMAQQRLYALNLSGPQQAKAMSAITDTVRNLQGMRLDEVTDSFMDLHVALGKVEDAIEFLPLASKYRFNMKTLFGDMYSNQQISTQILDTFKFLEQTGITAPHGEMVEGRRQYTNADKENVKKYLETMGQIVVGSKGTITGSTFRQLISRGGVSLMGMSTEGLKTMGWVMQAMGGQQAGTSMMSLWSKFVGGQIDKSALANFMKLVGTENVDTSKIQFGKGKSAHPGIPTRVTPGWFRQSDLLQSDPLQFAAFMEERLKVVAKLDRSKMEPEAYAKAATSQIFAITRQRTAARLLADLILQQELIKKDKDIFSQAKGVTDQYSQTIASIPGKIEAMKASMENFHAVAGTVMIEGLGMLAQAWTPVLKGLGDFLALHPEMARMLGIMIIASKTMLTLGKGYLLLKFYGSMGDTTVARAAQGTDVGYYNVRGAGGRFVSKAQLAAQQAEAKASRAPSFWGGPIGGKGAGFGGMAQMAIGFMAASFGIEKVGEIGAAIYELNVALQDLARTFDQAAAATTKLNNVQKTMEERIAELEGKKNLTKAEKEELAQKKQAVAQIKAGAAERAAGDAVGIMQGLLARQQAGGGNIGGYSTFVSEYAALKDPAVMKAFMVKLIAGVGSFEGLDKAQWMKDLQEAFPEAFHQATEALKADSGESTGAIAKLGDSIRDNLTPAARAALEVLKQLNLTPKAPEIGPQAEPKERKEYGGSHQVYWERFQRGGGGGAGTVQATFHIDARGAELGVEAKIQRAIEDALPRIRKHLDDQARTGVQVA